MKPAVLIAFLALCPALAAQLPRPQPLVVFPTQTSDVHLGSSTGELATATGVAYDRTLVCGR